MTAKRNLAMVAAMPASDILTGLPPQPAVLLLALVLDGLAGDPRRLYRHIPHPVQLAGWLIATLDQRLNIEGLEPRTLRRRGLISIAIVVLVAGSIGMLLHLVFASFSWGWLLEAAVASTLIAARGLYDAVLKVAETLPHSLRDSRNAISHIVGRDPESLDEAGIARAAIETLAENFSDGVAAPLFWFAVAGLPGIFVYKVVNTADSMIGHRNSRHLHFGRAAARLDDAANLLPARLSGLLICVVSALLPGADGKGAWRAMRRDARGHRSPNAGWPEAAMAGALGLALAGPRRYGDETVEDSWMGDGRREVHAGDIRHALGLYLAVNVAMAVGLAILVAIG